MLLWVPKCDAFRSGESAAEGVVSASASASAAAAAAASAAAAAAAAAAAVAAGLLLRFPRISMRLLMKKFCDSAAQRLACTFFDVATVEDITATPPLQNCSSLSLRDDRSYPTLSSSEQLKPKSTSLVRSTCPAPKAPLDLPFLTVLRSLPRRHMPRAAPPLLLRPSLCRALDSVRKSCTVLRGQAGLTRPRRRGAPEFFLRRAGARYAFFFARLSSALEMRGAVPACWWRALSRPIETALRFETGVQQTGTLRFVTAAGASGSNRPDVGCAHWWPGMLRPRWLVRESERRVVVSQKWDLLRHATAACSTAYVTHVRHPAAAHTQTHNTSDQHHIYLPSILLTPYAMSCAHLPWTHHEFQRKRSPNGMWLLCPAAVRQPAPQLFPPGLPVSGTQLLSNAAPANAAKIWPGPRCARLCMLHFPQNKLRDVFVADAHQHEEASRAEGTANVVGGLVLRGLAPGRRLVASELLGVVQHLVLAAGQLGHGRPRDALDCGAQQTIQPELSELLPLLRRQF